VTVNFYHSGRGSQDVVAPIKRRHQDSMTAKIQYRKDLIITHTTR
jgi:hypothetical protein